MSDLKGNLSQKKLHSSSDPPLLLEGIGTETKKDNIKADKMLGRAPCTQQKSIALRYPYKLHIISFWNTQQALAVSVHCVLACSAERREADTKDSSGCCWKADFAPCVQLGSRPSLGLLYAHFLHTSVKA